MPYCENCGTEVSQTARFCRSCGSSLNTVIQTNQPNQQQSAIQNQPAAPQPANSDPTQPAPQISNTSATTPMISAPQASAPPTVASAEPVIGVIFLRKPKSLGRYDSFAGVLTNQRFIFAQITSTMLKDAAMQARDQAKAEGKGFFAQWADQMKASFNFTRRYYKMEPNTILNETPGNYQIHHNTISEVKLKLKNIGSEETNRHEFEIEVKSNSGKYEFRMDENKDNIDILKKVYCERVKMPFGYFNRSININLR